MTSEHFKSKTLLIPDILFHTETVTNINTQTNTFQTMELVRKDQDLIRLVEPSKTVPTTPAELTCGKHTRLSTDQNTLLADMDGFPLLSRKKSKEIELIEVEIIPLVSFSHDQMEAHVTLYPPVSGCSQLTHELLLTILEKNNIRFGLLTDHLKTLLIRCNKEKSLVQNKTIARGLLPLNGKDSYLRFAIEVGPLPGKLLGNGKIDFRERKMFVGVTKGQTIATRVPPTDGTPGLTVCGEPTPQIPGKNLPVTVSDDAEYDEKSGVIQATHSGILSLVNDHSIKVCAKQVIDGNIDYTTGNIESQDAVEIKGTILPGFIVNTHGDLLLGGNARSASINCHGNLVIKGGIIGKQCKVKVRGDADFSFMEQGRLQTNGKVIIRKQAYYAKIMADDDILCEPSSQIMAGTLMSGASINLGNVGSLNAPPASIAAGIAPGRYLRFLRMQAKLRDIEQERLHFLQRFGFTQKIDLRKSLEQSIETLHHDMTSLNLIPGTTAQSIDDGVDYLRGITIKAQGTVFCGTELRIGNVSKTLTRTLTSVQFSLDKYRNSSIETTPLGK